MTTNTGNLAPYAPLANVVGLIRRRRDKGLPEILNTDKLIQLGIPEGNISRTLQALRFLNLIDEEGRQLTPFTRLATAKENEYPTILADIIRSAYHDAFTIIGDNPNDVTDRELVDAFRVYQPETQRNRMIILFRGLCQEAGLLAGGPPETRTRQRTGAATTPSSSRTNEKKVRLNGTSRGASQPHEAPRDDVPFATHRPTGTASGSVKTIRLRKGESLTLSYSGDMFHIDKKDRELVNRLIDAMDGHEQEIPNGDMYDGDEGKE